MSRSHENDWWFAVSFFPKRNGADVLPFRKAEVSDSAR